MPSSFPRYLGEPQLTGVHASWVTRDQLLADQGAAFLPVLADQGAAFLPVFAELSSPVFPRATAAGSFQGVPSLHLPKPGTPEFPIPVPC